MKFSPEQIVEILETPMGRRPIIDDEADPIVVAERSKIVEKYHELRDTTRWFPLEELRTYPGHTDATDGKFLYPDITECSTRARAWWLEENVLSLPSCEKKP